MSPARQAKLLVQLWQAAGDDDWLDRIAYLPPDAGGRVVVRHG